MFIHQKWKFPCSYFLRSWEEEKDFFFRLMWRPLEGFDSHNLVWKSLFGTLTEDYRFWTQKKKYIKTVPSPPWSSNDVITWRDLRSWRRPFIRLRLSLSRWLPACCFWSCWSWLTWLTNLQCNERKTTSQVPVMFHWPDILGVVKDTAPGGHANNQK